MRVLFRESFLTDVEAIEDTTLRGRIQKAVIRAEQAAALKDIGNIKKLKTGNSFYRVRVGDYRLGFVLEESTIVFTRCLHRRDIYRYFP